MTSLFAEIAVDHVPEDFRNCTQQKEAFTLLLWYRARCG